MFIFDQISMYAELDRGWFHKVIWIGYPDIPAQLNLYYV